jgi:uncharacterized membrane protein YwzB
MHVLNAQKRWTIRLLWIVATAVITWAVVAWTLEYYQYSEYMKWNISHGQPGN